MNCKPCPSFSFACSFVHRCMGWQNLSRVRVDSRVHQSTFSQFVLHRKIPWKAINPFWFVALFLFSIPFCNVQIFIFIHALCLSNQYSSINKKKSIIRALKFAHIVIYFPWLPGNSSEGGWDYIKGSPITKTNKPCLVSTVKSISFWLVLWALVYSLLLYVPWPRHLIKECI